MPTMGDRPAARIFISSTAEDLRAHRSRVRDIVESLGQGSIRMETFGARPEDPVAECQRLVTTSDAVIVLVAHRYGWVPSVEEGGDGEKSITWLEVDAALSAGRPLFVFLVDEAAAWHLPREQDRLVGASPADFAQIGKAVASLQRLKTFLASGRVVDRFTTPDDLAAKVATSVIPWLQERRTPHRLEGVSADLLAHLRAHIARYEIADWVPRQIELRVQRDSGEPRDAKTALREWAASGSDVLFVVGDFGSGKTGLLRWLAHELATRRIEGESVPYPVFMPMRKERRLIPRSAADLVSFTDPPTPASIFEVASPARPLVLLLDGLDELLDAQDRNRGRYVEVLSAMSRVAPAGTRFVVSCRIAMYAPIATELATAFRVPEADPTDLAIRKALGTDVLSTGTVRVCDLRPEDSDGYLLHTGAADLWALHRAEEPYQRLSRLPFTVRLLEHALPELSRREGQVELDTLYSAAIKAWLLRDDPHASARNLEENLSLLETIAAHATYGLPHPEHLETFVNAGILWTPDRRVVEFSHYSLYEYFVARVLAREILGFDASTLARLNLIGSYNLNRFLVPMLRRSRGAAGKRVLSEPVSRREFSTFLAETGWRRGSGYGLHPSLRGLDGTPHSSGRKTELKPEVFAQPDLNSPDEPVTGISWYDAFAFCRWSGGRMPLREEIDRAGSRDWGGIYVWGWDWYDEPRSHVAVYRQQPGNDPATSLLGLNPDFRHSKIGLCVWGPDGHP